MNVRLQTTLEIDTYDRLVQLMTLYDKETVSQMIRFIIKDWMKIKGEIKDGKL